MRHAARLSGRLVAGRARLGGPASLRRPVRAGGAGRGGRAAPGEAGGLALHLLHRYAAALAAVLLAGVALRLRKAPQARNAALATLTFLLIEALLGALTVASGHSLWLAVAHNVGAALLLAAAAGLMHSVRQ
ncbi:MAG: hypothetical protein B6D47_02280 [Rhodocyclaceae bacterium UTPRO2]|nr:MAG: hypothetical protein B6D47_02280 [Rhodocyclaceae bacterium UTPRO2]